MQSFGWTESARHVLADAREEASVLKHERVRLEHLLLALAKSNDGTLVRIWAGLVVDSTDLARVTLASLPAGQSWHEDPGVPFTAEAKRVLEFAMREASTLSEDAVEPAHILLGLFHLGEDTATHMLQERGVTADRVRAILTDLRGRPVPDPP
jgi:ATP-dependent Clp protease ATP-binding subunit ClpA